MTLHCDNGAHVSFYSDKDLDEQWHTPEQDEDHYWSGPTPTTQCFDCLDESAVQNWLEDAKQTERWTVGNNCADAASQAIAAGLGNQSKPACPCSRSVDQRWVVEDLLSPGVAVVMPSHMEKQVEEMVDNDCNRYKCVLKNLHHGRPIN
jgi:hypothetical protein